MKDAYYQIMNWRCWHLSFRRFGFAYSCLCLLVVAANSLIASGASAAPARSLELTARPLLRSIDSLTNNTPTKVGMEVLLRGVVTYLGSQTTPNAIVFIQDQTGAIALTPIDPPPLALGDEVEVLGTYQHSAERAYVAAAQLHQLWSGSDPVPIALRPDQGVEGAYDGWLVQSQGRLIQKTLDKYGATLVLESEHQFFTATLSLSTAGFDGVFAGYEPGMVLELIGVSSVPASGLSSPTAGFTILLRSPDDIHVVRPAPWINLRHVLLLSPLLLAILFTLHRVHIHNLNLRYRAVMDERSRIAREIHDTMAQGFSGVALQLEGVADDLRSSGPARASHPNLDIAMRMVRYSREEAHDSIFVLRSLSTKHLDLLATLKQSAELKMTGHRVEIISTQQGNAYSLPDDVKHNLLRIGQEAISNALRHAACTCLKLRLHYLPHHIEFEIADDGVGFDPASAASIGTGHFGLTGMHERAAAIDGRLKIHSNAEKGTRLQVTIPRMLPSASPLLQRVLARLSHV